MCNPGPVNLKPYLYQLQRAVKRAIEERGDIAMAEMSEAEQESIFEDLLGLNSEQRGSSSAALSCLAPEPVAEVKNTSITYP